MYRRVGKRLLDLLLALLALPFVLLVLALLLLPQLVEHRGRVFFVQRRPGKGGRLFPLLKLRTMRPYQPTKHTHAHSAARVTGFGAILRRWSLDELPEVFNILLGHMSWVGPRPLLKEYLPRYSPEQARRHAVRPGLTGLAQVAGRNALDWPTRLALDVQYVDKLSLRLDLKILLRTVSLVLSGRGVRAGTGTLAEFKGNPPNAE